MRNFILSVLIASFAGCAAQPANQSAPATTPAPAAATPLATPAGGAPSAKTGASAKPMKAPSGYRLVNRDGATLYCKKMTEVGSNVPKVVCVTPEDYEAMLDRMELDRQNFRRNSTLCGTGGCGAAE